MPFKQFLLCNFYFLQICKFYLVGSCSYGKLCRYDHVKSSKNINKVKNEVQKQLNGTMFFSFLLFFLFFVYVLLIFFFISLFPTKYIFFDCFPLELQNAVSSAKAFFISYFAAIKSILAMEKEADLHHMYVHQIS